MAQVFSADMCGENNELASDIGKTYYNPFYTSNEKYDDSIYLNIQELRDVLNDIITNKADASDDTKNWYDDLLNNINNDYTSIYTDNIADSKEDYEIAREKINNLIVDLKAHYFEYYLMVKQINEYSCCFKPTFSRLLKFLALYVMPGRDLCYFNGKVQELNQKIQDIIDYIKTNEITDDMSTDEKYDQMDINAVMQYTNFYSNLSNFSSDLKDGFDDYSHLYILIDHFLLDMKLMLKVISIGNIMFTADDADNDLFTTVNNSMITYQSYQEYEIDQQTDPLYYQVKEVQISTYSVPIFKAYKSILKPNWSNFKQALGQGIIDVSNSAGIVAACNDLANYLNFITIEE